MAIRMRPRTHFHFLPPFNSRQECNRRSRLAISMLVWVQSAMSPVRRVAMHHMSLLVYGILVLSAAAIVLKILFFPSTPGQSPSIIKSTVAHLTDKGYKGNNHLAFPQRIVHLDLKGGQLRVEYFSRFFKLMRSLDATGVLIEWEDTFPYKCVPETEDLKKNRYTATEVAQIIKSATDNGLTVIPLVQTFGHMEHVLKLQEFASLRENPLIPRAICPQNEKAIELVYCMLDDVINTLKEGARVKPGEDRRINNLIHLGMDEVYELGQCPMCKSMDRQDLYTQHVKRISEYVQSKHGMKSMIWADMIGKDISAILEGGNGESGRKEEERLRTISTVTPVFWSYAKQIGWKDRKHWKEVSKIFGTAWGASAFKGADGLTANFPNTSNRLGNHLSWLDVAHEFNDEFKQGFGGIILTGWSRYHHFGLLCELLPIGIPTLALSLEILRILNSRIDYEIQRQGLESNFGQLRQDVAKTLDCQSTNSTRSVPDGIFEPASVELDQLYWEFFQTCDFPGGTLVPLIRGIRDAVGSFKTLHKNYLDEDALAGPFNGIDLTKGFIHSGMCKEACEKDFVDFKHKLDKLVRTAKQPFNEIFPSYVFDETIETKLGKIIKKTQILNKMIDLSENRGMNDSDSRPTWPNRVLKMDSLVEGYLKSLEGK